MKPNRTNRLFWFFGIVILLGTAIGASVVMNPSQASSESAPGKDKSDASAGFLCRGFVDLESGVTNLYPSQVGEVAVVDAKENVVYRAGAILLSLDKKAARAQLNEAIADEENARELLAQAEKLPKQDWQEKIKQQKLAIQIAQAAALAAAHELTHRRFQLKNGNVHKEIVDAGEALVSRLDKTVALEKAKLSDLEKMDIGSKARLAKVLLRAKTAKVEQARLALEKCDLKAPVDGKVLRVLVNKGEILGPNPKAPVILFAASNSPRIVRAEVDQEFAARVAKGCRAVIQDDANDGQKLQGTVIRLSDWYTHRRSIIQEPLHFNDVRTLECIVQIDGKHDLRIGQRVRVTIGRKR